MKRARFRGRVRAVLDVDQTIAKVDSSLDRFNETLAEFSEVLDRFNRTLDRFAEVVTKVDGIGNEMELITRRLGPVAGSIEAVGGPVTRIRTEVEKRFGGPGETDPDPDPDSAA